jgi:hypothetical protein
MRMTTSDGIERAIWRRRRDRNCGPSYRFIAGTEPRTLRFLWEQLSRSNLRCGDKTLAEYRRIKSDPDTNLDPGSSLWPLRSESNPILNLGAQECAGVCLSWAQFWAQTQTRENFEAGKYLKKVVGRDGIEPPTPGFSVLAADRPRRSFFQRVPRSTARTPRRALLRPIAPCRGV